MRRISDGGILILHHPRTRRKTGPENDADASASLKNPVHRRFRKRLQRPNRPVSRFSCVVDLGLTWRVLH